MSKPGSITFLKTWRYAVRIYRRNHNTGFYSDSPTLLLFETKVKAIAAYNKAVKVKSNRVYLFDIRKNPNIIHQWWEGTQPEVRLFPIKYHE